jgi:hypothetical protein
VVDSNIGTVADGAVVGSFSDYDGMVERLRQRAAAIGLSYAQIDFIAGLGESGLHTFFAITETLGIKAIFVEDEKLLARMKPRWQRRNAGKVRPGGHSAKRLGPITIARSGSGSESAMADTQKNLSYPANRQPLLVRAK